MRLKNMLESKIREKEKYLIKLMKKIKYILQRQSILK